MLWEEVGPPNTTDLASLMRLLKLLPHMLQFGIRLREEWRVDQVQVQIIGLHLVGSFREHLRDVNDAFDDLAGDEELVAWNFGFFDGDAEFGFSLIVCAVSAIDLG